MAKLTSPQLYDVPPEIVAKLDQYDFVLADETDAQGFRVDWSSVDSPPVSITHESQLATGGQDSTEGDELYSGRDLTDAYRIIYRDFGGGAGQISRDTANYASNKFFSSDGIDISDPSGVKLMPAFDVIPATDLRGAVCEYQSTLAVTVDMGSNTDDRKQVAFYHPETPDELWTYAPGITADFEAVSLCSDGEWLYVALAGTGGVWRGKDPRVDATAWTQYSQAYSISYMCYNSGWLYGVMDDNEVGRILATADGSWNPFEIQGALAPARDSFGLSEVGAWVYWGVRAGARSWVYALQYNPSATDVQEVFEQYVELPTGFVGTCLDGYLGQLFIGGYNLSRVSDKNQGAVYLATEDGIALLTNIGGDPNRGEDDSSAEEVKGIAGYGHDLWIVTASSVYLWNLKMGGLAKVGKFGSYASEEDINTSEQIDYLDKLDYGLRFITSDGSFVRPEQFNPSWLIQPENNGSYAFVQGVKGTVSDDTWSEGLTQSMSAASAYAAPTGENKWAIDLDVDETLRVYPNSSTPHREARAWWVRPQPARDGGSIDNAIGSTFEVTTARINGNCAELGIRDGVYELAVRLYGGTTTDNTGWEVQIGRWRKATVGYEWAKKAQTNKRNLHRIRLTLKEDVGRVYVDGALIYETVAGELRSVTDVYEDATESTCFYFTGGWCYNRTISTYSGYNKTPWVIDYASIRCATNGAWSDDAAILRSVTSTTNFTVLNSTPYVPSSGSVDGLVCLDWDRYLSTSSDELRNYGELLTSWSTARWPGVIKDFSFIDISHDPVAEGDQLLVYVETDFSVTTFTIEPGDEVLTKTALRNMKGSKVRCRIRMSSHDGTSSPKVSCISLRFGVPPVDRIQFLVDLRDNLTLLTGERYDAAGARLWLEERIMSGGPLMLYRRSGMREVVIEAAQDTHAYPSATHDSEPQGMMILRLKVVSQ